MKVPTSSIHHIRFHITIASGPAYVYFLSHTQPFALKHYNDSNLLKSRKRNPQHRPLFKTTHLAFHTNLSSLIRGLGTQNLFKRIYGGGKLDRRYSFGNLNFPLLSNLVLVAVVSYLHPPMAVFEETKRLN